MTTWTIIITGIVCDEREIVALRNHLRSVALADHPDDIRTLTMQQWLWHEHWRGTADPQPPPASADPRLIRETIP
jgi:hypothetical protein